MDGRLSKVCALWIHSSLSSLGIGLLKGANGPLKGVYGGIQGYMGFRPQKRRITWNQKWKTT